jgi:uncharacterized protein YndB with AHSA1/START domain
MRKSMAVSNAKPSAALVPDFVMTRVFDAPRSLVFEAWTKPEHLVHWWGRKAFSMPFCEIDFRPGGVFRLCMRSPAGLDYWVRGVYREIIELERIVFTYALEKEERDHEALLTVTFSEHEGKTTLTLEQALFDLRKAREGAQGGWIEGLDRLAAYMATKSKEQLS